MTCSAKWWPIRNHGLTMKDTMWDSRFSPRIWLVLVWEWHWYLVNDFKSLVLNLEWLRNFTVEFYDFCVPMTLPNPGIWFSFNIEFIMFTEVQGIMEHYYGCNTWQWPNLLVIPEGQLYLTLKSDFEKTRFFARIRTKWVKWINGTAFFSFIIGE